MIGNGARDTIHRPIGGVSGRGRTREPRGLARPPGARDRRTRDRQGIDRRAPAPPVDALGPALCDHELRRDARDIDRKRVVRARGGRLHRSDAQPRGALRGGRRTSEGRGEGEEWVSTVRSWWTGVTLKQNTIESNSAMHTTY